MQSKTLAVGVVVALAVLMPPAPMVQAQGQAQAVPAVDVDRVLHTVMDALGILRDAQERDAMMTVEYFGSGMMYEIVPNTPPRAFKITRYYGSIAYDFPGMRVDITRTSADGGAPQRLIQAVSGTFAWDETGQPGGGLDPAFGNAVPAKDAVSDRLLRLWTTPFGVIKAARVPGTNPKVSIENGATVINFILAGPANPSPSTHVLVGPVAGTPVKLTLDAQNRPAKVEVRRGTTVTETTYSDYGDLNPKDYQADIFFPAKIVQKVGGQTVLDLTIERTNTYNPYVILPVPENVQKAGN